MSRRRISDAMRLRIFQDAGCVCHICGGAIKPGERWEVEHVRALALLGGDDESNMRPAHFKCHKGKTAEDSSRIAKAKRQERKHLGVKRSSRPVPGSRNTPWKRKIGGRTERRDGR